jgi:hypothetical protein
MEGMEIALNESNSFLFYYQSPSKFLKGNLLTVIFSRNHFFQFLIFRLSEMFVCKNPSEANGSNP